jgi:phospholipase C
MLITSVYNALRGNSELWSKTLLIVLFDEHGGFYDHVEPPGCVAPDYHHEEDSFLQLGVRVPAVLVSPWIRKGVCPTLFDHTSLLKYLSDLWGLGYLGERAQNAKTFAEILLPSARSDTPPLITSSTSSSVLSARAPAPLASLNGNQKSILALSHLLEVEANEDPNIVVARSRQLLSGPQAQIDVACDRVDGFIEKQITKVHI